MVVIKAESPVDASATPVLHKWDIARRENYNAYEEKINENLYQHQRMANTRWPYSAFYPRYYQHYFLELNMYKNLQALGKYYDEEVEEYEKTHPRIRSDLKHTFKTTVPIYGIAAGLALQVIPIKYRLSLGNNLTVLLAPIAVNWIYDRYNISHKHNANLFLDWALSRRVALAQLEKNKAQINAEQVETFRKNFPELSPLDVFRAYTKL